MKAFKTSHIRIILMRMLEYSRLTYINFMKRVSRHVTKNLQRDWVIACFGSRIKTFPKVGKLWTGVSS